MGSRLRRLLLTASALRAFALVGALALLSPSVAWARQHCLVLSVYPLGILSQAILRSWRRRSGVTPAGRR
jgi:hypothetical protein